MWGQFVIQYFSRSKGDVGTQSVQEVPLLLYNRLGTVLLVQSLPDFNRYVYSNSFKNKLRWSTHFIVIVPSKMSFLTYKTANIVH